MDSGSGSGARVFVGVDRSQPGLAALRFAVDEARRRSAPLHAVRVTPRLTLRAVEEIDAAFDDALGGLPGDIVVHREVLVGSVADTLTRRAHYSTDVLIVGTDGGRQRRGLFGLGSASIGHACVRKARCPVLIVPDPPITEPGSVPDRDGQRVDRGARRSVHRTRHALRTLDAQ